MRSLTSRQRGLLFFAGGLFCFLAAFGMVWFFTGSWRGDEPTTEAGSALRWIEPEPEKASVTETPHRAAEEESWVIYITGAVKAPGVYTVPPGIRIYEVVDRAGGLTADADAVAINLARPLQDGDHIHVPKRGEEVNPVSRESAGGVVPDMGTSSSGSPGKGGGKVSLNRASGAELETLPGVGPKTAVAIIRFRKENGPFRSVEDLIQVRGIGPAKMAQVRGLVTVRP